MKNVVRLFAVFTILIFSSSVFAGQIYAIYGGSQNGVTVRDSNTLVQMNFFNPGFISSSIVAGNNNNMYLTSGNRIYNYTNTGTQISSFAFPSSGINYHGVAYAGSQIYTAYNGGQNGVTVRDSTTFNQTFFFDPGFAIDGITAGNNSDMYLTSGNNIYNYSNAGNLINSFSWPSTSIDYSDTTYNGAGKLYTVYDGAQQGVTIRDSATLAQQGVILPGFSASGIASGDNNDLYLTLGNKIYHYSDNGTLLTSLIFSDSGINYTGITYASAVPIPAGIWLFGTSLLLFGFNKKKRMTVG